ncbi:MAG: LysR family transcriptional regulator [Myxococcaceae bacterium]|nr:LysR family transcriptional regulator [Myxococcaceae bacterium]
MTTEQLTAFVMVAERRQLTDAARRLGTSQPGISRQLSALERELGVRLLVRTPRGVALTEAGEKFLAHAREALSTLRAASSELHEIAESPRGAVSLGVLPTVGAYVLPGLLAAFLKAHPHIRLKLRESLHEELKDQVADGTLDLAILELPVRRQDLVAQKLWEEPYLLVVPKSHPLASGKPPVRLEETVGEPLVVVVGGKGAATFRQVAESRGEEPRIVLEVNHPESLRRMVEKGVGIALLPELMTRAHRGVGFVALAVEGAPRRTVAVVHRGERSLTFGARALKRFLIDRLRGGR